jgi:predicted GNAT superfamily acetyltransferase
MTDATGSVKEPGILIRPLQEGPDMRIGVDLQQRVWNYSDIDTVPDQMFVVARETGGQVLGAFHRDQPIGFAMAFVGAHRGVTYLHSHMVGVVPDYQDRGVGRMLKLAQREDAIARGFDLIEWTFDPLQLKNAYFNIARLGAIIRRYIPNLYGRTTSPLHAGLPTDRLVAEWWLRSPRVENILNSDPPVLGTAAVRISIPSSIRQICAENPAEAEKIQSDVRKQFERHISSSLAATGFEFEDQRGSYLMEPYED